MEANVTIDSLPRLSAAEQKAAQDILISQKQRKQRKTVRIVLKVLFYLSCVLLAVGMVFPFYWSLITAFRAEDQILTIPIKIYPSDFTLQHFIKVFEEMNFFTMFFNSVFTSLAGLFTNLFFGTLAAYSFAKMRFKGHKIIFNIMLLSLMVPSVVTIIPQFMIMLRFPLAGGNNILGQGGGGLYNNLAAVFLPGAIGVYAVFFMRSFFVTLADDMAESARIDGAGEFRIFWQIYLPLVLPGLLTLGIFTFQGGWNNYLWPSLVLSEEKKYLLTMGFVMFKPSMGSPEYGPLMALSVLMALPVVLIFICMQKYFIQGVAVGGTKG